MHNTLRCNWMPWKKTLYFEPCNAMIVSGEMVSETHHAGSWPERTLWAPQTLQRRPHSRQRRGTRTARLLWGAWPGTLQSRPCRCWSKRSRRIRVARRRSRWSRSRHRPRVFPTWSQSHSRSRSSPSGSWVDQVCLRKIKPKHKFSKLKLILWYQLE